MSSIHFKWRSCDEVNELTAYANTNTEQRNFSHTSPQALMFHCNSIYLDSSLLMFHEVTTSILAATILKFHEVFGILVIHSTSANQIILSRINEFYLVEQHVLISVRRLLIKGVGDLHFTKDSCMKCSLKPCRTPFGVSSCMNFSRWYSSNRCKIVLTKRLSGIIYT